MTVNPQADSRSWTRFLIGLPAAVLAVVLAAKLARSSMRAGLLHVSVGARPLIPQASE